MAVIIVGIVRAIVMFGACQRHAFGGVAIGALTLTHPLVIFPCIEQKMQPRHHLFDRRQRSGRTGLAARAGFAPYAGLALRAYLAAGTLRAGLAWRTRF